MNASPITRWQLTSRRWVMLENKVWRSEALARTVGETALGWLVADHPDEYDWRVVDAALDQLVCTECGSMLTRGPAACQRCTYYNEMRCAARETDRPNVPRCRTRYTPQARVGYELALPALAGGNLPTTRDAQWAKALINKLTPEECDRVATFEEALASLALAEDPLHRFYLGCHGICHARPDVGLEDQAHTGCHRSHSLSRSLDDGHDLIPLALDGCEHRIGVVGQAAGSNDPHGFGDRLADGFAGAEWRE